MWARQKKASAILEKLREELRPQEWTNEIARASILRLVFDTRFMHISKNGNGRGRTTPRGERRDGEACADTGNWCMGQTDAMGPWRTPRTHAEAQAKLGTIAPA